MIEVEKHYEKRSKGNFLSRIRNKILELHRQSLEIEDFNKNYTELKEGFIKEYPDEAETIAAIFDIKSVLEAQRELEIAREQKKRIEREKLKELMRNLTEWHFLVTHLFTCIQDKSVAASFWTELSQISKIFSDKSLRGIRKGIIGQVGVYKTLKKFGLQPKIAHPDEDAFEKMDLSVSSPLAETAIQTKYTEKIQQPLVIKDDIDYPSVFLEKLDSQTYLSHYDIEQMMRLRESCRKKSARIGKKIEALYLAIPEGSFDPDTGEPTEKFLKQIEPEIKKYLK